MYRCIYDNTLNYWIIYLYKYNKPTSHILLQIIYKKLIKGKYLYHNRKFWVFIFIPIIHLCSVLHTFPFCTQVLHHITRHSHHVILFSWPTFYDSYLIFIILCTVELLAVVLSVWVEAPLHFPLFWVLNYWVVAVVVIFLHFVEDAIFSVWDSDGMVLNETRVMS